MHCRPVPPLTTPSTTHPAVLYDEVDSSHHPHSAFVDVDPSLQVAVLTVEVSGSVTEILALMSETESAAPFDR